MEKAKQEKMELVRYTYNYESGGINSVGTLADIKYKARLINADAIDSVKVSSAYFGSLDGNEVNVSISVINALVGDVNNDSIISSEDTLLVLQSANKTLTLTGRELVAADVNDDGIINATDALLINKYIAKLIDTF